MDTQTQAKLAKQWGTTERVRAVKDALTMLPHNQTPTGLGFTLQHSPSNCLRCRAEIAILELGATVRYFEQLESEQENAT